MGIPWICDFFSKWVEFNPGGFENSLAIRLSLDIVHLTAVTFLIVLKVCHHDAVFRECGYSSSWWGYGLWWGAYRRAAWGPSCLKVMGGGVLGSSLRSLSYKLDLLDLIGASRSIWAGLHSQQSLHFMYIDAYVDICNMKRSQRRLSGMLVCMDSFLCTGRSGGW